MSSYISGNRQVEAHELEIQKLYEEMDTQLKAERKYISSHVSEEF